MALDTPIAPSFRLPLDRSLSCGCTPHSLHSFSRGGGGAVRARKIEGGTDAGVGVAPQTAEGTKTVDIDGWFAGAGAISQQHSLVHVYRHNLRRLRVLGLGVRVYGLGFRA